ncbi:MAG: serine protein kinase PrkA [Desulfuromonadaceae bacterium]|nr:serine protein kinase PrkA [Desulfuromonadaceae bacterium]
MQRFSRGQQDGSGAQAIPFRTYLERAVADPTHMVRNIFQVFHDMIYAYVEAGVDEYQGDPESINYAYYDTHRLFIEGADHPFFADRLFSNRLVQLAENFRRGAQQNKIYIFKGPHGCGKSTFLDNLLRKFEHYVNSPSGHTFEAVWRLDKNLLSSFGEQDGELLVEELLNVSELRESALMEAQRNLFHREGYIEVPCPSHDSPILMIPREYRRSFFDDLFTNDEIKWKLFTEKQYEWVFRETPCTICTSIYEALLSRLKDPMKVLQMLYARHYRFNRRLGEGISVYNPGDRVLKQNVLGNDMLQRRINGLLRDSNQVQYVFSNFAKTNNGVYALMDIKRHNVERLLELHNIISEGIHKVEYIEERVNSLFLALMNPEDENSIRDLPSLSDRIEYIKVPYVLDLRTEVEIYRNTFGRHIDEFFLPRVLHNFARIIISTRLNPSSPALSEWIGHPGRYSCYCDKKLQLLKMEIYTGNIPEWLQQADRKRLTAERRRRIISESENEGESGFSGRDSIRIFSELFSSCAKEGSMIDMATLCRFFTKHEEWSKLIPEGFLDALLHMYNYTILQEVKEALYYYNEEQIARDLKNYIFAVNFESGTDVTCPYTGDRLKIAEPFFAPIERHLLDEASDRETQQKFRQTVQKEYAGRTLTQELRLEGKDLIETHLYDSLHERYVHHLKEKVLEPFLDNKNFRRGIKDYDTADFKTYDNRIRADVTFLMENLCKKYKYSKLGAKEVCIYLIDNDLARKFSEESC